MCEYSSDYEVADVWSERDRKARKTHECRACDGQIKAGETYRYISGIFEHEAFSLKVCPACWASLGEFKTRHSETPLIEELSEALAHCIEEDGPQSWAVAHLEAMKSRRDAKAVSHG